MSPFAALQNVALIAGFFAVYFLTGSWWGWLFFLMWLSPTDCKCKEEKPETSAIIREPFRRKGHP